MQLLLASKSPRRRELIAKLGYDVQYVDIDVDEHLDHSVSAVEVSELLARRKASAYDTAHLSPDQVLVAADTIVALRGEILGKPHDRSQAIGMLRRLSDSCHTVYTGVCLRTRTAVRSFTEATRVHFLPLSDNLITHYVDTYAPYDKAGAYGIQEWIGMVGISSIEGCFYNVMGLPLSRLYTELQQICAAR